MKNEMTVNQGCFVVVACLLVAPVFLALVAYSAMKTVEWFMLPAEMGFRFFVGLMLLVAIFRPMIVSQEVNVKTFEEAITKLIAAGVSPAITLFVAYVLHLVI